MTFTEPPFTWASAAPRNEQLPPISVATVREQDELLKVQQEKIELLMKQLDEARIELYNVRYLVREKAIELIQDGAICRDGTNDFFSEIGVEKYTPTFEVSFTITGTVTVEADSEDEAEELLKREIGVDCDYNDVDFNIDHVSAEYTGNA